MARREEQGYPLGIVEAAVGPVPPAGSTPSLGAEPAPTEPATLVLELGCEELPAEELQSALAQLQRGVPTMLQRSRLQHGGIRVLGTPRRLAVMVQDLAPRQAGSALRLRGPPVTAAFDAAGKPTAALHGFCKKQGVTGAGRAGRRSLAADRADSAPRARARSQRGLVECV